MAGISVAELLSSHDLALVDAIAERVVQLLDERGQAPAELVDAAALARILGVSRSTVYEHADRLGAIEVGGGGKPRLRFDVATARAAWTRRDSREQSRLAEASLEVRPPRRRRRSAAQTSDGLLPIRPVEDRDAA